MTADKRIGHTETSTEFTHLVFEQFTQRLDQFKLHSLLKTTNVVM